MRIRSPVIVIMLAAMPFAFTAQAASPSGALVKLACPNAAASDHPCKAVYYSGSDGKRHAFPNQWTYFSWYADFSGVSTISASAMAAMPLGKNVTYRPGERMVKFLTDPKTYAVGLGGSLRWVKTEAAATTLYGANWNTKVDDISDAFFTDYRFGADIASASDFAPSTELSSAITIDDNLPATHRTISVVTSSGTFSIELIKIRKDAYDMVTTAAQATDCNNGCAAKSLKELADAQGATIGIHGTYFCPPDYPDCASKTNTFLWPFFDSPTRTMRNASSLAVHEGPMITYGSDGSYRDYHRTKEFGSVALYEAQGRTLKAAVSNYPSLVENGVSIVNSESRLDDGMRTVKGNRGGIGYDDRFVYLVIARGATVPDLANVFLALGAKSALNLDGGGSSAMLFNDAYVVGPGRQLPNAILFTSR